MFRFIFFVAILLFLFSFAGVISILDKLFSGFRSASFKLRNDLRALQPELKSWASDHLIQWNKHEMELFSLIQHRQVKKYFAYKIFRGVFQSIYHEPLMVYLQKMYGPEEGVLVIRNTKHEFAYLILGKEVQVFIDQEYFGKLDHQGKLWYNDKNVIAQIDRSESALLNVQVNNKIAGSIINESKKETRNPRAFQYLNDMDQVEEKVFLCLAFYEVIRRSPKN
ncbi:MAG: hypothetical protein ABIR66_13635 [Saprospiraceae bacterium]